VRVKVKSRKKSSGGGGEGQIRLVPHVQLFPDLSYFGYAVLEWDFED
jgi:hypothetical protein